MSTKVSGITLEDMINSAFLDKEWKVVYGKNSKERFAASEDLISWFQKHYPEKKKENPKATIEILKTKEEDLLANIDSFEEQLVRRMRSYTKNKYTLSLRMEHFLGYLNFKYNVDIDLKFLDNFTIRDKDVRRIKILKHLHSGPKSRPEIANHFGITPKTLTEDLNALLGGIEFLGFNIKMGDLERIENTYKSKVNPIFYAANLSEIYSLTIGLKLLSRGTVFEHSLSAIADKVYMQLSVYAKEIIDTQSEAHHISFEGQPMHFLNTMDFIIQERPFTYYLKDETPCKVTYYENKEKKHIIGTLHLSNSNKDRFKKITVKTPEGDIELDINTISKVESI